MSMDLNLDGLVGDTPKTKPKPQSRLGINMSKLLAQIETFSPGEEMPDKQKRTKSGTKKELKISHQAKKKIERWLVQEGSETKEIEWHDGYHLEYLRKRDAHEKMMMYVVRYHNEVHVFRSKSSATKYGEWAGRDIETIQSEDYFYMVRPGMRLIAHDMTHRQLTIQPDGSVLVRLRPRHKMDSVMPITYTTDEIIALRDRFKDTLKPNFHSLARNPDLVNYVLNALGIQRSWREEQKFLTCLQNVFDMDEFAAFGSNISDAEPVIDYLVSHGGRRLRRNGRLHPREMVTVAVDGPEMRKPIESKANLMFREIPEVSFPNLRNYSSIEGLTCKAHWDAIRYGE